MQDPLFYFFISYDTYQYLCYIKGGRRQWPNLLSDKPRGPPKPYYRFVCLDSESFI